MKWSVIALFALGVFAAICAAMLVTSIQAGPGRSPGGVQAQEEAPADVQTVVATRDLEPMTVIEASAVTTRSVPAGEASFGSFTNTQLVIGKVLMRAVPADEPITSDALAREGSGVHVASALRPGMRAVSVALTDSMGLEGLLYPGSVVDVIASMSLRADAEAQPQPVSMTLLQGVFVLAVGELTVVSEPASDEGGTVIGGRRRPSVTLLVDSRQAEVLKLAMQEGSVSLVLRNPTDDLVAQVEGTALSSLAPVLAPDIGRQVTVVKGGVPQVKTFAIGGRE